MQCQIGLRLQVCLPAPLPLRLQLHFHLHFRLCLRSSNYVVICAIFGNACNDDNDEANDKFAALSSRLHVARCTLPGWQLAVLVCRVVSQEYVNWLANGCQCINLSCTPLVLVGSRS